MKVRHFIYASACVMGLAACNNEEIALNDNVIFDGKGELVELKDGFVLSMGKAGLEESRAINGSTRAFEWMPATPGADEVVEKIGLCWTGVNNMNPSAAPLQATGSMVYTNYEFSHAGWLFKGENTPEYDICDGKLENGKYLVSTNVAPMATIDGTGAYEAGTGATELNFGKGIFNTQNGAIYSGEYIVYYPYSNEFFDSPILASAPKLVEVDAEATNKYETVAKYAFNVGYVANFAGGQQSDNFATNMLSAGAYIGFTNTAAAGGDSKTIKQVVLLAAGANDAFITKQELSAQAIKNANNIPNNMGTGLYLGTPKTTSKTIVANLENELTVAANTTTSAGYVVLPVLPTTISDLKILLVNEDDQTALIDCGNVKFESISKVEGYSLSKNIDLKNVTFKKEYIATDWSSLESIINSVNVVTGTAAINVRTIGEIELPKAYTTLTTRQNVRFYGDKLIVPADAQLDLSSGVTVENDIDLMHKGCCGDEHATLYLYGSTLTGTINNYGDIFAGTGLSSAQTASLVGATLNNLKGTITEKGVEIEYAGNIDVKKYMTLSLSEDATINNEGTLKTEGTGTSSIDGTVTIEQGSTATIANSGLIENGGNINASNGLSNTTTTAVFVDKVGSQLAGFGLDNTIGGQYICEVNDQVRYNTAIESAIRPTTLVRFIAGGEYKIAAGDVNNSKGNMVDFEVKTTGAVTFVNNVEDDEDNELVSTVKNVYLTQSSAVRFNKLFEVEEKLNTIASDFIVDKNLIVGSEFNVSGATQISKNVNVNALNSTCAMNVAQSATITFYNFGKSYFQTIANNGKVDILVASGVQGVAHELWTKTYTTGTTGTWLNNSRPLEY